MSYKISQETDALSNVPLYESIDNGSCLYIDGRRVSMKEVSSEVTFKSVAEVMLPIYLCAQVHPVTMSCCVRHAQWHLKTGQYLLVEAS